jgi:hypothetical protein
MWIYPVSQEGWRKTEISGWNLQRQDGFSNMVMEGGYIVQKKMLPVGHISVLYFLMVMFVSADFSVSTLLGPLRKGSGSVGNGFLEFH